MAEDSLINTFIDAVIAVGTLSIAILALYRLDRKRHEEIVAELEQRAASRP